MQYALSIREHNIQAHVDIEKDIQTKKNGLFTFTLRVNAGNIVDYNLMEYVNAKSKYLSLKKVTISEFAFTHHYRERSPADTIRTDNIQHDLTQRDNAG